MSLAVKLQQSSSMFQPLFGKSATKEFSVRFVITPTGNYVAGGDPLDLTQLFALASGAPGNSLPSFELPVEVRIYSARPAGATGNGNLFVYQYSPGTTLANGTMQVFTGAAAQTALTELSAGAYGANILNDTINAVATFVMP